MSVKILDAWTNPGNPRKDNEDTWNSTQSGDLDLIWLLDGCTDVDRQTVYPEGKTNAFWYKEVLSQLLKTFPYSSLQEDPKSYIASIVEKIRSQYSDLGFGFDREEWAYPSSTLVMAAFSKATNILRLFAQGDSFCLVREKNKEVQIFPTTIYTAPANEELRKSSPTNTISSFLVEDQIDYYRSERANSIHSGLRSLSLFPDRLQGFQSLDISLTTDTDLLLASDGFFRLVDMHSYCSPQDLFTGGSLETLGQKLRHIENDKSAYLKATTSKIHDDATAVKVRITDLS